MSITMNCPKCGKLMNGNSCISCGYINTSGVQQWQSADIEKSKSQTNSSCSFIALLFVIPFVLVMFLSFGFSSGFFSNIIKLPGHRSNPIALGDTCKYKDSLYDYRIELSVVEAIRGEAAEQWISNSGLHQVPLKDGQEYVVVDMKIKALSSSNDEKIDVYSRNFDMVSQSGVSFENMSITGFSNIFPGGETTGYIFGAIDTGDNPLIGFQGSGASSMKWFKQRI